jgi:hypothetical protein
VRVERRVIPVCADMDRRIEVFERELWRIAVEFLDYGEQVQWAALAGARVAPSGWRRARAMLHFDKSGELKRNFLLTAVERNKNSQLRLRALQEIAQSRDADAFERAVDVVRTWSRDERREGVKILLQALAERRIGRRDQASHWIWDLADMTREVHEEYAVQRWPETKRLLGLLVNSSGGAHARNARRLVHAARKQDRRLSAALLAAAVAHTPEAMEVVRGARTRMARKPSALSRELLRNFPKRKSRSRRRRKKGDDAKAPQVEAALEAAEATTVETPDEAAEGAVAEAAVATGDDAGRPAEGAAPAKPRRRRSSRRKAAAKAEPVSDEEAARAIEEAAASLLGTPVPSGAPAEAEAPAAAETEAPEEAAPAVDEPAEKPKPKRRRTTAKKKAEAPPEPEAPAEAAPEAEPARAPDAEEAPKAKPRRRRAPVKSEASPEAEQLALDAAEAQADAEEAPKPKRRRAPRRKADEPGEPPPPAQLDDAA